MSILTGLLNAAVRVVTLPITIAADAATMCGVLTDRDRSYTGTQLKKILKDIEVDE